MYICDNQVWEMTRNSLIFRGLFKRQVVTLNTEVSTWNYFFSLHNTFKLQRGHFVETALYTKKTLKNQKKIQFFKK